MDYLKFNCHDMAVQGNELYKTYNKTQALNNELDTVLSALDPQIKSYEGLQKHFLAVQAETADITMRVQTAADALDQIVDVYYSAENKALQASERLPVKTVKNDIETNVKDIQPTSASVINNSDLVLEDWLAELVYKYGKDENNR